MIQFFNSLGNKMEKFVPLEKGKAGLYTCGPTVYNYAHIGNFRAYVWEDILRRYLEFSGFKVFHIMNLTDVDDKTIKGSKEEGITLTEFTDKYKKAFFEDIKTLNILPAHHYPSATETISEMVDLVQRLLDKGVAYRGEDGCIYFSIKKFPDYGKLAGIDTGKLKEGARISADEYEKEGMGDFALWKAWTEEDGPFYWETKLGAGRPGWHIECSAMSMKFLGESFDIHTGGVDNKFPHHENEIAQSEAATGKRFVKYWMHCEHLMVDGKKMSKSLGNFYTLRDLLDKGLDSKAIRFTLANANYRQPLNFTLESVEDSHKTIKGLQNLVDRLNKTKGEKENDSVKVLSEKAMEGFRESMDDNLNMPRAMSFVFEFEKEINRLLDGESIGKKGAEEALEFLKQIDSVVGVLDFEEKYFELSEEQEKLVKEREDARKAKDFGKADEIRDRLKEQGIGLVDKKDGTTEAGPLE